MRTNSTTSETASYLDDDEHPGQTDGNEEATDHFESPRGEAEAEEGS